MALEMIELELPKKTYDLAHGVGEVLKKGKDLFKDGFQTNDAFVLLSELLVNVAPNVQGEGIEEIKREFDDNKILFAMSLLVGSAEAVEYMLAKQPDEVSLEGAIIARNDAQKVIEAI